MTDRITMVRKEKGYSQEQFANELNLSRNFINQLEAGKKNPSERTVLDICSKFSVNETWLRTGEGEMFVPKSMEQELIDFTADMLLGGESFKKRLISALAKLTEEQWDLLEGVIDEISNKKE